jgi:SAM-dependent methyltransferase
MGGWRGILRIDMNKDMDLQEVNCPICESPQHSRLHREGSFQMVRCLSCQFIYLNPRPTDRSLFDFYQDYLPEGEPSVESWKRMMRSVFKRAAKLLEQQVGKGRLLDVGTGFGFFLPEMKRKGWDVMGVEISQKGMEYARDVLGLQIQPGPLEAAGFPANSFDAVTGFYVIEHLPNPMAFFRECHRILKPGGILLLRYPHTTPIKNLLSLFGVENRLYDLPAHLSDFSPRVIQQCLERTGLRNCKHLIGGYTLPDDLGRRMTCFFFGNIAEALFYLSGEKFLFPGVSKTVLVFKGEK